ncbi:hypothetical protein GF314_09045 [bacterium]|nr:hypothetical protein [bacterium]
MLRELRIANLALAEDVVLRPGPGLTALTGETGAGKSLVAGALSVLIDARVDRGLVRQGADVAWVEALCDLDGRPDLLAVARELGIHPGPDHLLMLRREIRSEGRGRVLIDGQPSSLAVLQSLASRLFSIQSQDQKRELTEPDFARALLDEVLDHGPLLEALDVARERFDAAREALTVRRQEMALAAEQLDMWRYQHDELAAASLRAGEEEELSEAIAVKRHAQAMLEAANQALEWLETGQAPAREALGAAQSALAAHTERSARLDAAHEHLAAAADLAADAASEIGRFVDGFGADPRDLEDLEARKALYEDLRRKYRRDVPGLIALAGELAARIDRHADGAGDLAALEGDLATARAELTGACSALHEARAAGAARVTAAAEATIRPLALPELDVMIDVDLQEAADGEVELAGRRCRVGARGCDRVRLRLRTNPGEAAGEAAAIASGGEAARVHLGLTVLRQRAQRPLLWLFDEVDAGLGMDAATPVALLLRELARGVPVICITHLPTVAVHAAEHWRVSKQVEDGRTAVRLVRLADEARVEEIARQLGGEGWRRGDAAAQSRYARELLEAAAGERAGGGES